MKATPLDKVVEKATADYETHKIRLRHHYQLARQLGLPPVIAKAVQGWSQQRIIDFAKEFHDAQ